MGVAGHLRGRSATGCKSSAPGRLASLSEARLKNNGNYGVSLAKMGRLWGVAGLQSGAGAAGTARRLR